MITLGVDVWRLGKNQSEHRIVKPEISTLRPPKQGSKPKRRGKMLHFPIARRRYYRYTCLPSDSFSLTLLSPTTCSMLAQLFPQPPAALLVSVFTDIRGVQKPVGPPKLQRNVAQYLYTRKLAALPVTAETTALGLGRVRQVLFFFFLFFYF